MPLISHESKAHLFVKLNFSEFLGSKEHLITNFSKKQNIFLNQENSF